jgi:two-component system NarL family response regulator
MPGQGSRFVISVPLSFGRSEQVDSTTIPLGAPTQEHADSTPNDPEKLRIILAEDHRIIRQGLVSVISDHPDIDVVGEASNGREAVDLFRRVRPDVVLMDVSMPIMDGIEATRQIRSDNPGARIIGLSMYEEEQVRQAMRDAGAEAFVNKADTSGQLLRAIYGITS